KRRHPQLKNEMIEFGPKGRKLVFNKLNDHEFEYDDSLLSIRIFKDDHNHYFKYYFGNLKLSFDSSNPDEAVEQILIEYGEFSIKKSTALNYAIELSLIKRQEVLKKEINLEL